MGRRCSKDERRRKHSSGQRGRVPPYVAMRPYRGPDVRAWGTIKNAAATLALHGAGNLEHFIGAALGGTGEEG